MNSHNTISTISMNEVVEDRERNFAFFDYIMTHIEDIALLVDRKGNILYANNRAAFILGYSISEISTLKVWDLTSTVKDKYWNRIWTRLSAKNLLTMETDLCSRWGAKIPVHVKTSIVDYKGTDFLWALMRRQYDQGSKSMGTRIKRTELTRILESTPDVVVRYDRNLRRTFVNKAWERVNGIPGSNVIGKAPHETDTRITPMADSFEKMLNRTIETGKIEEFDINWESADGPICYSLKAIPEFDNNGEVFGILTFATDTTAQKREIQILHEREHMFQTLLENSPDTISRYDLNCNRIYANKSFARLAGFSVENLLGKRPSHSNKSQEANIYEKTILETARSGQENEIEYEWPGANGRRIVSHIRIVPEYDSDGRIASVLCTGRDITRLKRAEAKMKYLAHYDSLTSLPNRTLIRKQSEIMLRKAHLNRKPAALLFMDLDNFKSINDTLGHIAGDEMLLHIASLLRSEIRKGESVGRLGGDEFLFITSERATEEDAKLLAWKIIRLFEQPIIIDNLSLSVSVSIGIALSPDNGTDFDTLLRKADAAMYDAKKSGRNTFAIFSEKDEKQDKNDLVVYSALKHALKYNEFTLHYQPQISLENGSICGAEALIRWNHPERGLLQPLSFIPIAESHGMIAPIGEWALREACRNAEQWRKETGQEISIAVNVSALQFRHGNLEKVITEALSDSGLSGHLLEIELTESAMLYNMTDALKTMHKIKDQGVKISLDDFGTGYSSLSQITKLPLDRLKIDASFITQLEKHSKEGMAIIRTIIQVAKTLNLETIAEGIETQEALDILRMLECDSAQGYLFSKPLPQKTFLSHISDSRNFSLLSLPK